ncbi:MAG TPA: sugar phosphate nucleotidyltransferase [Bacilli bacterium]|nr:sugar phosphate nucleotidyltransferase [Bacilli bacterium]
MVLVIMAAGMGSRFGGLKQIEPIGPSGEFIIDYSIYDAVLAGFTEVVFIIKKENIEVFKETVGKRVENRIKVTYVSQDIKDTPVEMVFEREKPWGTGQAILATKDVVKGNFMVINADDFYGRETFLKAAEFLKGADLNETNFAMIGYETANTLTENGAVKRGVCQTHEGYLISLIESSVEKIAGEIIAKPLDGRNPFKVSSDSLVSMNAFAFTPALFPYLEKAWEAFFKNNNNLEKEEFLIPTIVEKMVKEHDCTVKVLKTKAKWYGITYKEDKEKVMKAIKDLVDNKEYNNKLWE